LFLPSLRAYLSIRNLGVLGVAVKGLQNFDVKAGLRMGRSVLKGLSREIEMCNQLYGWLEKITGGICKVFKTTNVHLVSYLGSSDELQQGRTFAN
jgi:hypothetical protein